MCVRACINSIIYMSLEPCDRNKKSANWLSASSSSSQLVYTCVANQHMQDKDTTYAWTPHTPLYPPSLLFSHSLQNTPPPFPFSLFLSSPLNTAPLIHSFPFNARPRPLLSFSLLPPQHAPLWFTPLLSTHDPFTLSFSLPSLLLK